MEGHETNYELLLNYLTDVIKQKFNILIHCIISLYHTILNSILMR